MDLDKQDALNTIENSIYRTAFKLRSVQTLCQLDLIDSSSIQRVLCQSFWEARESSLSEQQLSQALQKLFQRVRVGKPGAVYPRASELTLSLLTAMYDSTGTGFLKLEPAAAALIALSGDSPLTKYRALFQLYAENNRRGYDSGARMTRKVLRNLLTDLQQIPTVVGESRALCSVDSAVRSCFRGVLSPTIKEEKFLSWLQSEPPVLLWLPTCYRLSTTEMVTHPVRCSICRNFPIMGVRYRCLKCLNFDICQVCFLSGLHSKSHQKSHPVFEHCVQMSAKENTKLLIRTVRDNLLQGRCRKKEAARRQGLLEQMNLKHAANQAQARLSIQYKSSKVPTYVSPTVAVKKTVTETSKQRPQRISQSQQTDDSSPHHQTMVSIRKELWRTHESITALHKERRLFEKQLSQCKVKMQAIYASQEERNCRFETKIHQLTTNQNHLRTKLQQMGQDLQAALQPRRPSSSSCQNLVSKKDHSSAEKFWRGGASSQIKNATEKGLESESFPNPTVIDRSHRLQANAEHTSPNSGSPEAILQLKSVQSTRAQSQAQKTPKAILSSLPSSQSGFWPCHPQIVPAKMSSAALILAERKETVYIEEEKNEQDEEELQQLLSKLLDAFPPEMPSGPQSSITMDLYCGAEQVCNAFSALIDEIILPKESRLNGLLV
ncbi:dystrotelin [Dasypus novemcinctus]|uniref:dystrotelin n=1 Tax=Dasypus novemcinctus TaxID=9361 RepID=UPI0039C8D5E1